MKINENENLKFQTKKRLPSQSFFSEAVNSPQLAIYKGVEELAEILVAYFLEGLESGERCVWITDKTLSADRAKKELEEAEVNIDSFLSSSQLEFQSKSKKFLSEDPAVLASEILNKRNTAKNESIKTLSDGFTGFRINLDLGENWPEKEKAEYFLQSFLENFKKALLENSKKNIESLSFEKSPLVLCTLPLEKFSVQELIDLLEGDELFLIKQKGKWKRFGGNANNLIKIFNTGKTTAEGVSRIKDGFITNMNHELRTPLNSIIGFSDLLLEGNFGTLNTKQSQHVSNIQRSGKNLLEIINNLVDASKLETGEKSMEYEDVNVAGLVDEVRTTLIPLAFNKKITLKIMCDSSSGSIRADRAKLKQILYNLLSNALKFTPQKGVINVSTCKKDDELEIQVTDNGVGISRENQEKIFSALVQEDSSLTKEFEGVGLGLYITKNFVNLHKGKITVESEPGKGSTFTVTIPANPLPSEK